MNEQQPVTHKIVREGDPLVAVPIAKRHRRRRFTVVRNSDFLFGVSHTKSALRLHLPFVAFTFYRKDYRE